MTPKTRRRARPKRPHTTPRSFRVPDPEYDPATVAAEQRDETLTDAVRRFLRLYGTGDDPTTTTRHIQEESTS